MPASQLQYLDSTVVAGLSYQITISSVSSIGEGSRTNPLTIWAVSPPAASVIELTDTARDSCTVQWAAVAPPANSLITGYMVYIDDGLDGDFSVGYDGSTNPS